MPEKYGGLAADYRPGIVIAEECAKLGFGSLTFPAHSDIIVPYIIHHGTDTQKQKYLPGCLSGDIVTAIAMTEPGTGSDLQGVKTSAVLDNDEYIINGSKTFISNGQLADIVIVVCKTGKEIKGGSGISLIIVEADTPGFEKGRNLEKIGMKAQDTSELFFNDVRVPKGNLLGHEGMGFKYLMQELPQERISIAIEAIAVAEEIFARTVEYVKERHAFGSPIAAFQNTQFKLAEMDAEITSIRVFVDRCLELHLDKKLDSVTAAKAKLLATELVIGIVSRCLQLHGGYGYTWDYPVARAFADTRAMAIFGGTSEIMKLIIGRTLLA
jgi:acyl-CoA dehydrogenase